MISANNILKIKGGNPVKVRRTSIDRGFIAVTAFIFKIGGRIK